MFPLGLSRILRGYKFIVSIFPSLSSLAPDLEPWRFLVKDE